MKIIKIFLILSLVIFSFARVTKKNEANLKSKASKKVSTFSKAKDVLSKQYGGDISVNGGNTYTAFLRAFDLEYFNPKGLVFRTENGADLSDTNVSSLLVRVSAGLYYLPYRRSSSIQFTSPWANKDFIYASVSNKNIQFKFWYNSWDNGSGQSLTQRLNDFRTRRITYLRDKMKNLSTYATNYLTAKQGVDAANGKISGVDTQITSSTNLMSSRVTLRVTDLSSANSFANQIHDEQAKLAALRKQILDLNTVNQQKSGLIDELNNAITVLNKQKSSNKISGEEFKLSMTDYSGDFARTLGLLKEEAVTDAGKVSAASDALIKTNNLDSCISILKTILP